MWSRSTMSRRNPAYSWETILTMSVLDHIRDDVIESLSANRSVEQPLAER
jgi:hypothetical protein